MLANANFDRSTVKHGTQNIQNDCHQWLSDSFRVHKFVFDRGSAPDPTGRAYSVPPDPLAGLRALLLTGRERGGRGKRGTRRGEEGNWRDRSPFANFWIRPCIHTYMYNACRTHPGI